MISSGTAVQSIQRGEAQFEKAASRLTQAATVSCDGSTQDSVDLSSEVAGLMAAQRTVEAAVKLFHTQDEMNGKLLNVLG